MYRIIRCIFFASEPAISTLDNYLVSFHSIRIMLIQVIDRVKNKFWHVLYANYLTFLAHHFIESSTKVAAARAYIKHFVTRNEYIGQPFEAKSMHMRG